MRVPGWMRKSDHNAPAGAWSILAPASKARRLPKGGCMHLSLEIYTDEQAKSGRGKDTTNNYPKYQAR